MQSGYRALTLSWPAASGIGFSVSSLKCTGECSKRMHSMNCLPTITSRVKPILCACNHHLCQVRAFSSRHKRNMLCTSDTNSAAGD